MPPPRSDARLMASPNHIDLPEHWALYDAISAGDQVRFDAALAADVSRRAKYDALLYNAIERARAPFIGPLLDAGGAMPGVYDDVYCTLLHDDSEPALRVLLERGLSPDVFSKSNVIESLAFGHRKVFETLVEFGLDPAAENGFFLVAGVRGGRQHVLPRLFDAGAGRAVPTAFARLEGAGDERGAHMLRQAYANWQALHVTATAARAAPVEPPDSDPSTCSPGLGL